MEKVLVGLYEEMVARLEAEVAAAASPGIRAGLEGLLEGARVNLNTAKEGAI